MSDIQVADLGCGNYDVYFQTRGGGSLVCRALNTFSISYSRRLNEVSEARISAQTNGVEGNCCACYAKIRPWQHELAIYRDGIQVWVGPIVEVVHRQGGLTIDFTARDLFAWFDKRYIEIYNEDYDVEDVDISDVFTFLVNLAYFKGPWNMTWDFKPTGIPITKFYPAYFSPDRWGGIYTMIGEELRNLTRSGVDWTVVKRNMIAGNLETEQPTTKPLILIDSSWATIPDITISGSGMATEVAVAGGQGGYYGWADDQMWIERPNDIYTQTYGVLQDFSNEDTLDEEDTTQQPNAVTENARGRRELKKAPFFSITGGQLAADAPVTFDTLIPGARTQIRLGQTCLDVTGEYRLYTVDVSVDNKSGETVNLQISPIGVDDIL